MFIADKSPERSIMYLKGHDSYIHCSQCKLQSGLPASNSNEQQTVPFSNDDGTPTPSRRTSSVNFTQQLSSHAHTPPDVLRTVPTS